MRNKFTYTSLDCGKSQVPAEYKKPEKKRGRRTHIIAWGIVIVIFAALFIRMYMVQKNDVIEVSTKYLQKRYGFTEKEIGRPVVYRKIDEIEARNVFRSY